MKMFPCCITEITNNKLLKYCLKFQLGPPHVHKPPLLFQNKVQVCNITPGWASEHRAFEL